MSDDSDFKPRRKRLKIVKVENPDWESSLPRTLEVTSKKISPLKHVSPILKKYSSQRLGRSVKTIRPKARSVSQPMEVTTKSIEETMCQDPPSTQPEVFFKPPDMTNKSELLQEQPSSPLTAKAHPESFPDGMPKTTLEDLNSTSLKNDPSSKEDFSPPVHSTSKMVKLTMTERKRSRIIKQRNRLQKELEHTVPLVAVDYKAACEEKGYKYALSYFLKTKERLRSDPETFEEFLRLMTDFISSNYNVVDLYHRISSVLSTYPDLCEEFLAFLLPEQALQCGRFMEHLSLAEMMSFLRKLEIFFSKQPQHLRKIYSCWEALAGNPNLTVEEVRSSIMPLLKGNKLLEDSFMEILPGASPPESKMSYGGSIDVEMLPYEDMDSELSDEEKRSERVYVPGGKTDHYGGENCHCCCHDTDDPSYASKSKHCVPCGMKFIAGKVYLQTEHGLRPVRVNFGSSTSYSSHLKRLNADPRKLQRPRGPRRSRTSSSRAGATCGATGTSGTGSKDNSPVKGSGKPVSQEEKEEDFCVKKSPRSRSKSISSRNKDKQPVRVSQQGSARSNTRSKGKIKMSISPPAAAYDEIALPATEPTVAKSDAIDFSVLSVVLKQEKMGGGREEDLGKDGEGFQIGSDDSTGEDMDKGHERPDSTVEGGDVMDEGDGDVMDEGDGDVMDEGDGDVMDEGDGDVIEEVDGDVLSDCSDAFGGDGDSDEAISVDSDGESDGDGESEGEGEVEAEGEASSQESEDCERRQAWTREEDRIILQCFQASGGQDDTKTFEKISQMLPARTEEEIKKRFYELVKLIQQLT